MTTSTPAPAADAPVCDTDCLAAHLGRRHTDACDTRWNAYTDALQAAERETAPACLGGSADCTGAVLPHLAQAARDEDLSQFPYCAPCRVAAHADSVDDEPDQGPRPLAPSVAASNVDRLLADARHRFPTADASLWAREVERWVRTAIEVAVVGLPTGGGADRDTVGEHVGDYAAMLLILTARMGEGTVVDRLYDEPEPQF